MSGLLGIFGGSGLYDLPGLEKIEQVSPGSGFGSASAPIQLGRLAGLDIAFMPRHGVGHSLSPSDINYRANIDSMKRVGVTDILSLSACGSLREDLAPGTFVIVDQFIDRTFGREKSFFGVGCVAHVAFGDPVCGRLGDAIEQSLQHMSVSYKRGGTYLAMEGPQFSTRAESRMYRSWGANVIGMTNMPEAKLAREAEICYATVAMITDYDSWMDSRKAVEVSDILNVMHKNSRNARELLTHIAAQLARGRPHVCHQGCDRALEGALVTDKTARHPEFLRKLSAVMQRVVDVEKHNG